MKNGLKFPILVYHRLAERENFRLESEADFYAVSSMEFEKQMRYLHYNGYEAITLDDFLNYQQGKYDMPCKPFMLTFDDGYKSSYNIAWPVLKEFGFKATFFIIVENVGLREFLDWEEIKELSCDGVAIGSHGLSHRLLTRLKNDEAERELEDSKKVIEDEIGKKVDFFALPGGFFNKRIKRMAKDCGYKAVCNSFIGLNDANSDLFTLRRIGIRSNTTLEGFTRLLQMRNSALLLKELSQLSRKAFKSIIGINNYTLLKERFIGVKE